MLFSHEIDLSCLRVIVSYYLVVLVILVILVVLVVVPIATVKVFSSFFWFSFFLCFDFPFFIFWFFWFSILIFLSFYFPSFFPHNRLDLLCCFSFRFSLVLILNDQVACISCIHFKVKLKLKLKLISSFARLEFIQTIFTFFSFSFSSCSCCSFIHSFIRSLIHCSAFAK